MIRTLTRAQLAPNAGAAPATKSNVRFWKDQAPTSEQDGREDNDGKLCRSPQSIPRKEKEDLPYNLSSSAMNQKLTIAKSAPLHSRQPLLDTPAATASNGTRIGKTDGFYDSVSVSFLSNSIASKAVMKVMDEALRILRPGGILNVLDLNGAAWKCIQAHPQCSFLEFRKTKASGQREHKNNTSAILEKSGLGTSFDVNDPRLVYWTARKPEANTKLQVGKPLQQLSVPAAAA